MVSLASDDHLPLCRHSYLFLQHQQLFSHQGNFSGLLLVYSTIWQRSHADDEGVQLKKLYESEAKKLKLVHARIANLENDMSSMKSNVEELEKQLISARAKEGKLNKTISEQIKEIEAAEETFYKAVTDWKLKKAKELFRGAYIGLVDLWDEDPNWKKQVPLSPLHLPSRKLTMN